MHVWNGILRRLEMRKPLFGLVLTALLLGPGIGVGGSGPSAWAQRAELPQADIVFLVDESGSMFNDLDEVRARIIDLVTQLRGRVDVQLGLVGFGAYGGHAGTAFPGEPHVHLPLSGNVEMFAQALGGLVANGLREPGLSAVVLGMSDRMGFRPDAGVCAVLISDEDADIYPEAPATQGEALAALQRRDAVFLAIVDPAFEFTASVYGPDPGSLAAQTGGRVFHLLNFRANPGAVLRSLFEDCIRAVTGAPPTTTPTPPPPPDRWEELQAQIERLGPTITMLLETVEQQGKRLDAVEERQDAQGERVRVLEATLEQLRARVEERFSALEVRVEETRTIVSQIDITSITATISQLGHEHQGLQTQLGALTGRLETLEKTVMGLSEDVSGRFDTLLQRLENVQERGAEVRGRVSDLEGSFTELQGEIASLRATLDALAQEHDAFTARFEDLKARLDALAERLEALPQEIAERFNAQLQDLRDALDALGRKQAEDRQRMGQLQDQITSLDQDLLSVRSTVVRLGEDQRDLRDWLRELAERLTALEKQLEALDALQQASERHARQIEELSARLDALSDHIAALKSDVGTNTAAIEELQGLLDEIAALKAALEELQGRLGGALGDLQNGLSALAERVGANEEGLASAHAQLGSLQGEVDALRADLEGRIANLEAQLRALADRLQQLEGEFAALQDLPGRVDELTLRIERLEALQAQMAELAARQKQLEEELAGLRRDVANIGPSLEKAKEEIKREVLAAVPRAPEQIEQEGLRPEMILRLAVAAFAFSLAAIAIAILV